MKNKLIKSLIDTICIILIISFGIWSIISGIAFIELIINGIKHLLNMDEDFDTKRYLIITPLLGLSPFLCLWFCVYMVNEEDDMYTINPTDRETDNKTN